MENTCFICGIDRFTFDTRGNGFEQHIRQVRRPASCFGGPAGGKPHAVYLSPQDHWMWTYLAMIVHLQEKDRSSYNGWENYVRAKLDDNDPSFLPRHTACGPCCTSAAPLGGDDSASRVCCRRWCCSRALRRRRSGLARRSSASRRLRCRARRCCASSRLLRRRGATRAW